MRAFKSIQLLVLSLFLLLWTVNVATAQTDQRSLMSLQGAGQSPTDILGKGFEKIPTRIPEEAQFALDVPIDPSTYILGPGDVLGISLRGGSGLFFQAMVTPEGNVLVPSLPMLHVNGLLLSDAIVLIEKSWSSSSGKAKVDVSLVQMRHMRVSLGGAVHKPGQFIVSPADRASVVVEMAGGVINDISSQRKATITFDDGTSSNFDMLRYMRSGNKDANPTMRAGAHITIQPLDLNGPTVEIGGGVAFPGRYEWLPTDDILSLVEVAGGFRYDITVDSLVLTHFIEDGSPVSESYLVESLINGQVPDVSLSPSDLVYVKMSANSSKWATVVVQGEVNYPGTYPVMLGITKLSDVIEQAGGLTDNAYLKGARAWRAQKMGDYLEYEKTRLDSLNAMLFTDIETAYLRYHARTLDRDFINVDFESALNGSGETKKLNDLVMDENLVINVPREIRTVLVTGYVNNPGLYPFVEGENYKYYVKQAGGYAKTAHKSRTRWVPFESPVWFVVTRKAEMGPGDMLFVPEKKEGMNWELFSQSFSLIIQTGTLVTLIIRTLEN